MTNSYDFILYWGMFGMGVLLSFILGWYVRRKNELEEKIYNLEEIIKITKSLKRRTT